MRRLRYGGTKEPTLTASVLHVSPRDSDPFDVGWYVDFEADIHGRESATPEPDISRLIRHAKAQDILDQF